MSRTCETCNHTKRVEIDRLLCQGRSISSISRDFGISTNSLSYHRDNHISRQMAQHMAKREGIDALGLMDELMEIVADTKNIFKRNYLKDTVTGDVTALRALDSRRATFDTILKACQLYHEAQLANLQNDREQFEQEANVAYQAKLKLLSTDELEMLLYLSNKMNGIETPVPEPEPKPILQPCLTAPIRRSPLPPHNIPPTPVVEAPAPEPEPEAKTLPPAPTRQIPGGRGTVLSRHLLGRKIGGLGER